MTVKPIKNLVRDIICPPDKSITHRAVMFNSLARGTARVRLSLLGEDCLSTVNCMRRLGAEIDVSEDVITVRGVSKPLSADLYAGNSGTTMRLLCGMLASYDGKWTIAGDKSLSGRPMRRVTEPLAAMGADITSADGKAPLSITGGRLHAIDYTMPVDSAQVKSAVILAALGAQGVTRITERVLARDHTEIMLAAMGARITRSGRTVSVTGGCKLNATSVTVAGDISSAAYPLVCALITGGKATVRNVGLNPTRTGLIEVFDMIGAEYSVSDIGESCGERVGTVTVNSLGKSKPFIIDGSMMPRLIDEIPVLAVLACFLSGDSVITGAEELRIKESDRIAATVRLIRAFGGEAQESASGFTVRGKGMLDGSCAYDSQGDHRMAMAAGIAAAGSRNGAQIIGGDCVNVSYPGFWEMLGESGAL